MVAFTIFFLFLVIFQCSPVSYFWNQAKLIPNTGSCISKSVIPNTAIAQSVLSFIVDWFLGLLPIYLLWNCKMNIQTKLSIVAILAMGIV